MAVNWANISGVPADLADGDDDTLSGLSCAQGQIVGWSGSAWMCTDDNGLTEQEVENYIQNGVNDLYAGATMNGEHLVTAATDQDS